MKILLNTVDSVCSFLDGCERCYDGDIKIKQGRKNINGKGVIGLFSLDLFEPLEAYISSENKEVRDQFYSYIKNWEVC